jgi:hypothetical protein
MSTAEVMKNNFEILDRIDWTDKSADMMINIGKHCKYEYCKTVDFLPFKCKFCEDDFCLEHRTTDGHECKKIISKVVLDDKPIIMEYKSRYVRCHNNIKGCTRLVDNTMLQLMISKCKKCNVISCADCRINHKC